jgi:hypothetical protein
LLPCLALLLGTTALSAQQETALLGFQTLLVRPLDQYDRFARALRPGLRGELLLQAAPSLPLYGGIQAQWIFMDRHHQGYELAIPGGFRQDWRLSAGIQRLDLLATLQLRLPLGQSRLLLEPMGGMGFSYRYKQVMPRSLSRNLYEGSRLNLQGQWRRLYGLGAGWSWYPGDGPLGLDLRASVFYGHETSTWVLDRPLDREGFGEDPFLAFQPVRVAPFFWTLGIGMSYRL